MMSYVMLLWNKYTFEINLALAFAVRGYEQLPVVFLVRHRLKRREQVQSILQLYGVTKIDISV